MIRFNYSRYKLTKRYARFSNFEIYFRLPRARAGARSRLKPKKVRFGYKVYQKIFRRYRSKKTLRINVRKPRIAVRRKTRYGKSMEIKNKFSYLLGGIHASKLSRFVRLNYSGVFSSSVVLLDSIESRLDVLVSKMAILPYAWIVKRFIKAGHVRVNSSICRNVAYKVGLTNKVSISLVPNLYVLALRLFKFRARRRLLFWFGQSGFEMSYRTFCAIKFAKPRPTEVRYPFDFNIYYFYCLYPR